MRHETPRPPEAGILNALRFGTDAFRFLDGVQARYDDIVEVPIPGRAPLVVVTNPTLVHDVLARPAEFSRVPVQGPARMIAENGLVQSEGDLWRQQRSIIGPAFAARGVEAYADVVGELVADLDAKWNDADGARRNLHREMTMLTVRGASRVLFGFDLGREGAAEFHEWMQVAGQEFEFSPTAVAPQWVPTRISGEFREVAENLKALAEAIIEHRREALDAGTDPESGAAVEPGERPGDMLGLLLAAEADAAVELPPNQIRDEVLTFLIAGHETTALGLSYTWSLLSWHPEIRERVREEGRTVIGEEVPRYEHTAELRYTRRVFREAIRLYPPAWAVFRRASGEVRLGDYRIRDGSAIILPQWSIHRDPRYFDDPERFDPDRWRSRDPGAAEAYFPFSSGPHACIGSQFSLTGATLVLAGLSRHFDVDVPEDALDDLRATPTLRPGDGVPATIRRVE